MKGEGSLLARWEAGSALVRILVVDDNPTVRHYLRAILEQQSAWQVCSEARSAEEALDRVQECEPDLILLDFQMPGRDGLAVAREIQRQRPAIPILLVSVHLSAQLAKAAQAAGIRGVCPKSDVGSIVDAAKMLLQNRTYFPPGLAERLDRGTRPLS